MIQFYNEQSILHYDNYVLLSWQIKAPNLSGVVGKIFRSDAVDMSSKTEIAQLNLETNFTYLDEYDWRAHFKPTFYQIEAWKYTKQAESIIFSQDADPDLLAIEFVRQSEILLKGVNNHNPLVGMECRLLKRNNTTMRCTTCWDHISQDNIVSDCPICSGTGHLTGYYSQVPIWLAKQPLTKTTLIQPTGELQQARTIFRTGNFPTVSLRDIIIERNENHWVVDEVQLSERQRYPVQQLITATLLSRDSIEYQIPYGV